MEQLLALKQKKAFQRALLRWFRSNGRDLPWRGTRDPYAILISELMLQQTQVATVLPYYRKWLRRFPDFASLASASESDVLLAWQGLGYYNRARYLRESAKIVQDHDRGRFPAELEQMLKLPGIGRYTANAVATFAFDQSVPIVEANTSRVLARLFDFQTPIDSSAGREKLWQCAATLVPKNGSGRFNSALVDLGALVCLPRQPRCRICPVKKFCGAKNPESLPIKRARAPMTQLTEDHVLVVRRNRILLEQSPGRWRGMWILPPLKLDRFNRSGFSKPIHISAFPFTNHRVRLRIFPGRRSKINQRGRQRWFARSELETIPIPSPHRRAIAALLH